MKNRCADLGGECAHTQISHVLAITLNHRSKKMKSTKVQNPRRTSCTNNEWLLATPCDLDVPPGQFSLLRMLAALVCLVWGKAETATRLSRTILHDALNGQTATSNPNSRQLHLTHVPHVDIVGHALYNIHGWRGGGGGGGGGLGHETILYMHTLYN